MQYIIVLPRPDACPFLLDQKRDCVHPEARDAKLQPKPHDPHDFALYRGIRGIEIWLKLVKTMKVVLTCNGITGPRCLLYTWKYDPLFPFGRARLLPDIPVPVIRSRVLPSGFKPGMPVRRVVDHEIDDHPHPDLLRVIHELDELAKRAVLWVYPIIVGNVVAIVAIRGRIKRLKPHAGD